MRRLQTLFIYCFALPYFVKYQLVLELENVSWSKKKHDGQRKIESNFRTYKVFVDNLVPFKMDQIRVVFFPLPSFGYYVMLLIVYVEFVWGKEFFKTNYSKGLNKMFYLPAGAYLEWKW